MSRREFTRTLADDIWAFHNAPPQNKQKTPLARDGFSSAPYFLVWLGWQEWKGTHRIPNRKELAERVERGWYNDLMLLDQMIERARPEPKGTGEPPLHNDW